MEVFVDDGLEIDFAGTDKRQMAALSEIWEIADHPIFDGFYLFERNSCFGEFMG
jgi:hypothetical protein